MPDFPPAIALFCSGLSSDGDHDLSAQEIAQSDRIASAIHRLVHWELPPNPFLLAAAEGLLLFPSPIDIEVINQDRVHYRRAPTRRDQGLWVAHAVAGAVLWRRGLPHQEVRAWCLAAQLLVPSWAHDSDAMRAHPWAPRWLVELRMAPGSRDNVPASAPVTSRPVSG